MLSNPASGFEDWLDCLLQLLPAAYLSGCIQEIKKQKRKKEKNRALYDLI